MDTLANMTFSTLFELARHRASEASADARRTAFTFLEDGEQVSGALTFGDLDRRARSIAAHLQQQGAAPGDRVLLVYPPSLEYIAAFYGCMYAGVIAVPALPPANARTLPRLQLIARDAQPRIALTLAAIAERIEQWRAESGVLGELDWLASDMQDDASERWQAPAPQPSDIAFLQYTSGSTGNPKGVMVSHGNIMANTRLLHATFHTQPEETLVSWLPPHHDMGLIGKILYPMYAGCHCVQFPPAAFLMRPYRWLKLLSDHRATGTAAPNFAYELCAAKVTEEQKRTLDLSALEFALNGAEPIRPATLQRFVDAFASCGLRPEALRPVYGLAESTLLVSASKRKPAGVMPALLPVSRAALASHAATAADAADDTIELVSAGVSESTDHDIVIVDPSTLIRQPEDAVGEIWVRGPSVAHGYWNRPDASRETFAAQVAGKGPAYMRTGDLGFLHRNELYITGRIKEMMIFNGRNLYPQDVEATIETMDAAFRANGCAVFALEKDAGSQLVIVQEIESRKTPATDGLAERLRAELSEQFQIFDVAAILLVKAGHVPRTSSGKIQRLRCRELFLSDGFAPLWTWHRQGGEENAAPEAAAPFTAARSDTEKRLAAIWQELFDSEELSITADFFSLGGHSLLATQMVSQIRTEFGLDLDLRSLFEAPTIETLAARIDALLREPAAASAADAMKIAPADRAAPLALSFAQQRLWFLDQLETGTASYNIPAAVRLTGPFDTAAFTRAVNEVMRRHESLRTSFTVVDGVPAQVIAPADACALDLPVTDLSNLAPAQREARIQWLAQGDVRTPFDLRAGPLLRARLLRMHAEEHVALFTLHHIIADGWSMGVFAQEVGALYAAALRDPSALRSALPELPIQYADFAQWQRQWLQGDILQRQLAYWTRQLEGAPALLALPTDRMRSAAQDYRGASVRFTVPAAVTAGLHAAGQRAQSTLFMTLTAAFNVLLARYSGQQDICIGTFIAGRNRADVEPLIGFFLNTLVLRTRIDRRESFDGLLRQVRAVTLDAYAHQDVPFEQVMEAVRPDRHAGQVGRNALFQVMLNLRDNPAGRLALPGIAADMLPVAYINSRFDLALDIIDQGDRLDAALEYNSELFDDATIKRMAAHFSRLLEAIAADPAAEVGRLPLLGEAERNTMLVEWNRSDMAFPLDRTYAELFAERVAAHPERVAAVCKGQSLTYRELDERAGRIARALADAGAARDTVVALLGERDLPLLTMMIAVMKAGAAFLPLEVNHPQERLQQILETSRVSLMLVSETCAPLFDRLAGKLAQQPVALIAEALWLNGPALETNVAGSPSDLAYVISTSGSTGKPKSAMVEQAGMLNNMFGKIPTVGLSENDRLAQTASAAFDISVWQFLAAPLVGATVHILPDEIVQDPPRLIEAVVAHEISLLEIVPSLMRNLLDLCPPGTELTSLRWVLPTGEALPLKLAQDWFMRFPSIPLMNVYGPAECSDDVAYHAITAFPSMNAAIPIGRPTPNNRLFIVDDLLQPVPVGVIGEICVAGVGVGRGYLHNPEQTAAVFLRDPFSADPKARFYRTGDLGRYRADGVIEFAGRVDHQVKIRGFRIELGEIESRLAALPAVRATVVVAREDAPGDKRLVAYIEPHDARTTNQNAVPALRSALLQALPDYMVPAHFVFLEQLPLSPNGKVDRKALPAPDMTRSEADYVAPRNPIERTLADIWADVLRLDKVGALDNFFALGGHSLLATQVVSRLRSAFSVDLPLRVLFETPTVEALAARIAQANPGQAAAGQNLPIVPLERGTPRALSFAQQRLWFLDQFETGSAFYNLPAAMRLVGRLDVPALGRTINAVVARHEALRTTFTTVDGAPVQVIAPSLTLDLPVTDLSDLPHAEREARAQWLAQDEAQTPFDLRTGPLLRARLLRLQENEHIALFTMHHIVSDGWSMGVLVREVAALYAAHVQGLPSPLPPLTIQYADFAHWQRQWLAGEVLQKQLDYWTAQLAGAPALLALPTDRPRPPVASYRGATLSFQVDAAVTARLQAVTSQAQATLFMTLAAVFNILLARHSGQSDISLGTPIANRNRSEIESLIGFFVNTLVLRTQVDHEASFADLLQQVRATALGAYAHQDVPFEQLVEALKPERHLSHAPLFQVAMALQNAPMERLELPGLTLLPVAADTTTAKFDLLLTITEQDGRLDAVFEYNTDLFDRATIERMAGHFTQLLAAAAERPDSRIADLPMLASAERERLLTGFNRARTTEDRHALLQALSCPADDAGVVDFYILDAFGNPVPVGVAGELHVGGISAPRAEESVPHPFGGAPGACLWRTGHLARYLPDGRIDHLGRIDAQVELRGFRIALGAIESALAALPIVREAAVGVHRHAPDDRRLVAYVVPHDGMNATQDAVPLLRAALSQTLPDYMVPAHFVLLDRIPRSSGGEVDREALPAPQIDAGETGYVAPRNAVEQTLADIWSEVLSREQIGIHDNFFALGGHSLLVAVVVSQVEVQLGVNIPVETFFTAQTIAALSLYIEQARQQDQGGSAAQPIAAADRGAPLPLSFAQQRLWFLDQFETGSAFYNIPAAIRLTGSLDAAALAFSINEIVRRHEALRTTFATVDGAPVQVIAPSLALDLPVTDLSHLPHAEREARAQWLAQDEAQTPFDLRTGPLLRARLLRLQDTEHIVLFTMHHIVSDGWSMGVLVREVAALYAAHVQGLPSPLPPLAIQYADFAHWQRQWLAGDTLQKQLDYWTAQLAGAPTLLALPTDRPRPPVQSYRGATLPFEVDAVTTARLQAVTSQAQATLFMTLAAAFNILLARYSGQSDIVLGTPIANRNRSEIESLIGFFVNTLVLRTQVDHEASFADLLQQVRATALGAYAHQDVPFEQLVEALKPERHLSHSPLFQVMLALQNAPAEKLELPGLSLQPLAADHATAKFDLTLNITEEAGRLHCELEYNTDLFEAATIERMAGHFTQLLAAAAERPDSRIADLPMLEAHERRRLLAEWNATAADYPRGETIHQLFEAQAARTPDAIALVFEERLLSYAELNARANRLAHYLRGAGVGPDVLAGISVERSLDLVIAVLAILKAGGAYVPLDPAYPKDRLAYMLADAKPAVLLTQRQLADNLPPHDIPLFCMDTEEERLAAFPSANPVNLTLPDNLAYVIYTSGSTGLPKGVQLRHSGLANLIHDQVKTFGFRPGDRVLQFASFNFDASTWEIFLTLLSGATLCMATREQLMPAGGLGETLDRLGITIAILPPVGLGMLVPGRQAKLETVIVGGEACSQALVAQWAGAYKMFNAYGPTEITVCATVHRCDADRSSAPPIGRPIANTQVYILDADMNPVPIGVAGEVHIGGDGLARGYLNRADLSAEKFIPNPFSSQPGARMYRSGDLARWLPNGEIEYLGRIDHQVKIRGFRIELGEIETKLAALPAVRDAVVLAREDIPGDKRLVAYVVPQESAIPAEEAIPPLRAALLQSLPDFMVPAHFVFLDKLPLSPNGKVERKLLPAPGMTRSEVGYVAPRNPVEQTLAEIWAEVLSLDRVGVLDNFFNLGGHSMLAMQMISKVRAAYDTDLPIRSLFESPTVATLAAQLEQILAQRTQQQAERKAALEAQVQMSIDSMSEEEIIAMLMAKKREKNN